MEVNLWDGGGGEEGLAGAIFAHSSGLSRSEQQTLLAAAADKWPLPVRCTALPNVIDDSAVEHGLLARFGRKLAQFGPWFSKDDCDALSVAGLSESAIVAAVATVALGHFRCTLAARPFPCDWAEGGPA